MTSHLPANSGTFSRSSQILSLAEAMPTRLIFRPQIISWEFATGRRRCAFTQRVPARASSQGKQQYAEAILAKSDIKGILSTLNRGLVTMDESTRQRFDCAVAALESLQKGTVATSNELLSANWELLWTTEKETLFILQWAKLFGTSAGGVFQPINVASGTLSNIITFPPSGGFFVNSTIQVAGPKRITFKFTAATLKLQTRQIQLPPYGQGWFDNVFIDEDFRISRDSRGDTLVTEKRPAHAIASVEG